MHKFRRFVYPYNVWLITFIIVPLFMMLYLSFTNSNGVLTLGNFSKFLQISAVKPLFNAVKCALAKLPVKYRTTACLLVIIPMWMNFLLRTYAWVSILSRQGILNSFLVQLGLAPTDLLYTQAAVILGMVYNFLPFMVLPIYTVLEQNQQCFIDAALDLGANRRQVFLYVILPLSKPGIISGITMVFIPAISTFEITALLGGNKSNLIGNMIEQQFTVVGDWHYGSTISLILMIFILISLLFDKEENQNA